MADLYQTGVNNLKGKLLVATPQLQNSPFRETVIFLTKHDKEGATGYVLNRPSLITVNKLISHFTNNTPTTLPDQVWLGGPLNERHVHMLHTPDWYSATTEPVTSAISISKDTFMLEKMIMLDMPREFQVFAGNSGWAPGQLENEIERNSWLVLDSTPAIVFSSKKSELWKVCIELCAQSMVDNYF